MIYRKIPTKTGKFRYSRDARFIKKEDIHPDILTKLETQDEVEDQGKYCLFCQKSTTWMKLLNGQLVYLCKEHYHNKRMGQIAEKLRNDSV